jgi:DNA-binding protein H-NS
MDRRKFLTIYEKAKLAYSTLNDYVTKEYIKTKTLEEALQQINELQSVQKHLESIGQEKEEIKNDRMPVENEISELEQKIGELTTKGPIDKLNMVNAEIDLLSNELKQTIRHLQKPFIKMQALATTGGGGGITPDQLNKINAYLDNPFDALTAEKDGYPELKEILEKMQELMAKDTLKLKQDKARKAEQSINEILRQGSLSKLQLRCKEMATNRDQLVASAKMDEIKYFLSNFQSQVDQLKARKTSIETHESVKDTAYNEAVDKIVNLKRSIEKNIFNSINVKIQIA